MQRDLPKVQSNQAARPSDVLLTLSGDDASCVVTAGPAPGTLMFPYRYLDISKNLPSVWMVKNPFHPARSAMFFKSLSGWLFLKHAVRFFPDCKSGFFPRGYSHSARMDFQGWKEAQEACLRGRTDNPENVSKEYPRFSICIIFISSVRMAP